MEYLLYIIAFLFWFASVILWIPEIGPAMSRLKIGEKLLIYIVVLIGAPCILVAQAIDMLLESLLNE